MGQHTIENDVEELNRLHVASMKQVREIKNDLKSMAWGMMIAAEELQMLEGYIRLGKARRNGNGRTR